jgi:2-amino-1-hydroxyethylphosphonate dioxygenase (glycine-forming)
MTSNASIKIKELFEKYGSYDYIGENVSQLEHSIQCAMMAEKETNDNEVIIAALLHDIGHLISIEHNLEQIGTYGAHQHEIIGYNFAIKYGLGTKIAHLIKSHVITKRYLVSINDKYYNNLSNASKKTLEFQGGKLNNSEIELFKNDPYYDINIKIRNYDDKAKLQNIKLTPLEYYLEMVDEIIY